MKIMLDPGHGGSDNGAVWGYAEEDDINLIVAFLLECSLARQFPKHEVLLTRATDDDTSLLYRTNIANAERAELFVSIHCDAWHRVTASGFSVHIHPNAGRSRAIAKRIIDALAMRFPAHRNRGVRESDFHVLRRTIMPAVLIECEFLSNPDTRRFLKEPENQKALADTIAGAIGQ